MRQFFNRNLCCWRIIGLVMLLCATPLPADSPHPDLLKKIQAGEIEMPYYLKHIQQLRLRGINAPGILPDGSNPYGPGNTPDANYNALAIIVDFSDNVASVPGSFFDNLLFGTATGTLRDYYNEVSYGNLTIITLNMPSALGWKRAPQAYSYYTNGMSGFGSYPQNAQRLAEDAIILADPLVNFSQYDNNSDGYVDALFIIHAGPGAEFTGSGNDIWSHKWSLVAPLAVDGVMAFTYSMEPEYWSGPGDMTCGVYAHEMGHSVFGLPDLYDRDGTSEGLGEWSIMASGSWNGPWPGGGSPAHPDAWCRYQMGYVTPTVVTGNIYGASIPSIATTPTAFRLWTNGVMIPQYFLVENRQPVGYDAALPGFGLCIYHVDEDIGTQNDDEWYPGHTSFGHYLVALEQADGMWNLEQNINRGDNGDPWPGSTARTVFDKNTIPDSRNYAFLNTDVAVRNIGPSGSTMTADLEVSPGATFPAPANLAATGGDGVVDLTWDPPSGGGTIELGYDDGTAESFYVVISPPQGDEYFAVGFSHGSAYTIDFATFYMRNDIGSNAMVDVFLVGDAGGVPDLSNVLGSGSVLVPGTSSGDWYTFDFTDVGMPAGGVFYVLCRWNSNVMAEHAVGADANAPDGMSWWTEDNGATWNQWLTHDWMFRATISSPSPSGDILSYTLNPLGHKDAMFGQRAELLPVTAAAATQTPALEEAVRRQQFPAYDYLLQALEGKLPQVYADATFDHYNIYRSTTGGGPYSIVGTASTESYSDFSVSNGTTYYYVVTAEYTSPVGESPYSNEAFATPWGTNSGILVWEGILGAQDYSGAYLAGELSAMGYPVTYTDAFPPSLTGYDAAFLSFGNYGNNYTPFDNAMAAAVQLYLEAGGRLYLEGGDALGYNQVGNNTLLALFGLDAASDGSTRPVSQLQGQPAALTGGMLFSASNQFGNSYIDLYTPNAAAVLAFEEVGYGDVAVQYDGTYGQKTFCFSYALAELIDGVLPSTRANLVTELINFLIGGPGGPLTMYGIQIDDDNNGNSSGNGDGIINPGEAIELYVGLHNLGSNSTLGISGCLIEDSPYVTFPVFNDCSDYPDILPGDFAYNSDDFDMMVDPATPLGHVINFTLTVTAANGGPWVIPFFIIVSGPAPKIALSHPPMIYDLPSGVSDSKTLVIENTGAADLFWNIGESNWETNNPVALPPVERPQHTTVDKTIPTKPQFGALPLDVTGRPVFYNRMAQLSPAQTGAIKAPATAALLSPPTGNDAILFFDDMESGINGWSTLLVGGSVDDLWHQTNLDFHSPSTSWWCGIEAQGNYDTGNRIDNMLISPLIDLTGASAPLTLEFYEYFSTEHYWDFCMVAVSADGGLTWTQLRGSSYWGTAPSGSSNVWILSALDISPFAGQQILIGYYFDTIDDAANDFAGWFIDDVKVYEGVTDVVPWLSSSPADGVVAPGGNQNVTVTANAGGMSGGTFRASLVVNNNDLDLNPLFVPVTLNVTGMPDIVISIPLDLQGNPGSSIDVPVFLTLNGNQVGALGAALKATNGILSYSGFTTGPIVPGAVFSVSSPAPDSVRIAFADLGGGPITGDGLLVTLHFDVSPGAGSGDFSELIFSELSAADPLGGGLSIAGDNGLLTVVPEVEVHGSAHYCSLSGGGDPTKPLADQTADLYQSSIWMMGDVTDPAGEYHLLSIPPGSNYRVEVQRSSGGVGVAVNPTDALLAFNGFLGSVTLSGAQKLAGDADGNLTVNPTDALLIFNYFLGTVTFPVDAWRAYPASYDIDATPTAWMSAPDGIDYPLLNANMYNQDFLAVARGDVNLTWPGATLAPALAVGNSENVLHLDIANARIDPYTRQVNWEIQLSGEALSQGLYAFGADLYYDAAALNITSITWGDVAQTEGYQLGYNFLPNQIALDEKSDESLSGILRFGGFSTTGSGLEHAGTLLHVAGQLKTALAPDRALALCFANTSASIGRPGGHALGKGGTNGFAMTAVQAGDGIIVLPARPAEFALQPNYPNPFNPATTIRYQLPEAAEVEVLIFNTLGQKLRTLQALATQNAGYYELYWDGTDDRGSAVASGIYFYQLRAKGTSGVTVRTRKMMLLK